MEHELTRLELLAFTSLSVERSRVAALERESRRSRLAVEESVSASVVEFFRRLGLPAGTAGRFDFSRGVFVVLERGVESDGSVV